MRKLVFSIFLWVLGATVASAAVVRLDVTGSGFGGFGGPSSFDRTDPEGTDLGGWYLSLEDLIEHNVTWAFPIPEFATATTGSAILTQTGITDCSGLLVRLCFGGNPYHFLAFDAVAQTFSAVWSTEYAMVTANQNGLEYLDDAWRSIQIGNIWYDGTPSSGGNAGVIFTSATLSVIPLPASAPLVLAAIGALALLRRRRG